MIRGRLWEGRSGEEGNERRSGFRRTFRVVGRREGEGRGKGYFDMVGYRVWSLFK